LREKPFLADKFLGPRATPANRMNDCDADAAFARSS
jgi:hypothetical protein